MLNVIRSLLLAGLAFFQTRRQSAVEILACSAKTSFAPKSRRFRVGAGWRVHAPLRCPARLVPVFVVMHVATRRIVLINVTTSPGLAWVKQQIRQATEWSQTPRFLLHDNDGIYEQYHQRRTRGEQGRRYRCHLDVWLADVMGIQGIPIPYGAPNASPHIERFNRTLREGALNHFIFLGVKHVLRVCHVPWCIAREHRLQVYWILG